MIDLHLALWWLQETALNHVGLSKFVGDGMGTTHAMMRHRLIWVVTRMHVEVDRYPVWYGTTQPTYLSNYSLQEPNWVDLFIAEEKSFVY
jgi:hypothetical protein